MKFAQSVECGASNPLATTRCGKADRYGGRGATNSRPPPPIGVSPPTKPGMATRISTWIKTVSKTPDWVDIEAPGGAANPYYWNKKTNEVSWTKPSYVTIT